MIEHTTRSREDAVSLSLSNSLYPKTNTTPAPPHPPLSCHFSPQQSCQGSFPGGCFVHKYAEHTLYCQLLHNRMCAIALECEFCPTKEKQRKTGFFFKKKEKPEGTEKALFLNERCSRNIKEYNQVIVDNHGRRTAKSIKT